MVDVEQLLAPVSKEAPCGEDLSYDPDLSALESLIQGKAETQFSEAEEPNWKEVQRGALALAERTKDLRVAIDLTLGLLKLDGWPGAAQGFALLRGLHERYWDGFYPRLDPDDDNDPTERTNLLAILAAPEGTFGDPMRFLERLRAAPLCRGARLGPLSLAVIGSAVDGAKRAAAGGEDAGNAAAAGPDRAVVEATFRDTPAEFLAEVRTAVEGSTADVAAIEDFWNTTVGSGQGPNLEALRTVLRDARSRLDAYAPAPSAEAAADVFPDDDGASPSFTGSDSPGRSTRSLQASNGASAPGEIASRQDVLGALDAVCAYYDEREPSSPVPALLRQARKMVGMNYFQLVSALTPDATPQVRLSAGESDDAGAVTPDDPGSDA